MTRAHETTVGTLTMLGLAVIVLAVYYPVTDGEYVFDDRKLVAENSELWEGVGFDLNIFADRSADDVRSNFRPLRFVSYKIDVWLTRWFSDVKPPNEDPYFFHLHNILLHALNCILVFLIVGRVLPDVHWAVAPMAALAFALHPIQTESVAYISGRRDVLFLFFYLTAAYVYVRNRTSASWGTGAMLAGLFVLALLTKEMAFSLPVALLALELLAPAAPGSRNWKRIGVGFVGLYVIGTFIIGGLLLTANPGGGVGLWGGTRLNASISAIRALAHYLGLLVWPETLTIDYSFNAFPASSGWSDPAGGLPALFLVIALAVTAIAAACSGTRPSRWIAVGIGLFFVTLLPVAQIFPHPERIAERFLYLPSLAFLMIVGGFVAPLVRSNPVPAAVGGVLLLMVWGSVTRDRLDDWDSRYSLWKSAVDANPNCARSQFALGEAARQLGRDREAVRHFSVAVNQLAPISERTPLQHGYYLQALKLRSQVWSRSREQADLLAARADLQSLMQEYDTGADRPLSEDPNQLMELLKLDVRLNELDRARVVAGSILKLPDDRFDDAGKKRIRLEAALTLAGLHGEAGEFEDAGRLLTLAEQLATTRRQKARVQFDRGVHYRNAEKWQLAADCFSRCYDLYEGGERGVSALYYHAECEDRLRRPDEARRLLEKLLQESPNHTASLLSLADMCVRQQDLDEAQRLYMRLLELVPGESRAIDGLRNVGAQKHMAEKSDDSEESRRALPLLLLGERWYAQGKLDEAEKALAEADPRAEGPEHLAHRHRIRRLHAKIAVEKGDLKAADERYAAYLKLALLEQDEHRVQTLLEAAEVKRRLGDPKAGIALLEAEWQRGVADGVLAMNVATLHVQARDATRALLWYRRALANSAALSPSQKQRVETMIGKLEKMAPRDGDSVREERP